MNDLSKLLGQPFGSADAQAFVKTLRGLAEVESDTDGTIYSYPAAGVSVSVTPNTGRIFMVVFYGPGAKRFSAYGNPLPEGLAFAMTRPEVEKLVGPADVSKGDEQAWKRATYRLGIRYLKTGRIRRVTIWGA
jgi:hypothetical protein